MAEEDEPNIPRAAMNKFIKELIPHVRVSNDSRELIQNCCTEFIHLIASEANDICNQQAKKTISVEHVLAALDNLGFGGYLPDVKSVVEECKTVQAKKRRSSNRLENLGIPEDELLRQQQELFAQARQKQAEIDKQEWFQLQQAAQQQMQQSSPTTNTTTTTIITTSPSSPSNTTTTTTTTTTTDINTDSDKTTTTTNTT